MLSPTPPIALVAPAIRPGEDAETVLLVAHVLAAVAFPVGPHHDARAVHGRLLPSAQGAPAVSAEAGAEAFDGVHPPLPLVGGAVWPMVNAGAVPRAA